jgi:hypothetical protein
MQQVSNRLIGKTLRRLGKVPDDKVGLCFRRWQARQPHISNYLLHAEDYLPKRCAGALRLLFWLIAESTQGLAELPPVSDELVVRAHDANIALTDTELPGWETRIAEHFASFSQMPLFEHAFMVFDCEDGCALAGHEIEPGLLAIKTGLDCFDIVSHTPSCRSDY